jgi:hypothetical protein
VLWLVLGGWIGAMLFFSAAVAPGAFAVLGDPSLAGKLVAHTLRLLQLAGAGAGLALALLAWLQGRGLGLVGLPLLLSGLCIVSHFGVTGALAEIRATPDWQADPALSARFASLHALSVRLLGLTLLGALGLLVAHARSLTRARKPSENLKNA